MTLTELIAKLEAIKSDIGGEVLCVHRSESMTLDMLGEPKTVGHTGQGEKRALMVSFERLD